MLQRSGRKRCSGHSFMLADDNCADHCGGVVVAAAAAVVVVWYSG